jgi:hypothetical protein
MARHQTIRLREATAAPAQGAQVIDAEFKEVRRSWWTKFKVAVATVFWAALIGFMLPPLWLLAQRISEQFAPG